MKPSAPIASVYEAAKMLVAAGIILFFSVIVLRQDARLSRIEDTRFTMEDAYKMREAILDSVPPYEVRAALDSLFKGLEEVRDGGGL